MLTPSIFSRRLAIVALLFLVVLYALVNLGGHSSSRWVSTLGTTTSNGLPSYETFQPSAISSVCSEAEWTPGLVFTCDESGGGIGNLRNSVLNCVRYSIAAGASLVVPRIVLRNAEDITKIWNKEKTGLDYIFDQPHFVSSLRVACPGLKLYHDIESIYGQPLPHEPLNLLPESLVAEIPRTGLSQPDQWRTTFYAWLNVLAAPTIETPVIVHLQRSYLQFPVYYDGDDFAHNFGLILQVRSDAQVLADKVLKQLSVLCKIPFNDKQPITQNAFFGVHLRTEKDAVQGWPPQDWEYSRYDTQSKKYLEQASRSNTSIIYVASGDEAEIKKFAGDALQVGDWTVTTKFDLLKGKDLKKLKEMAWDQQALVDYQVMLRASDFAGVAHSSFAWNIALRRHLYAKERKHLDGPEMLSDDLSQIYGQVRGYPEYAACMWP